MPTELQLLKQEKLCSYIVILAALLVILSASISESEEIAKNQNIKTPKSCISPTEITALATIILIIGRTLTAITASQRLRQRIINVSAGTDTGSLNPNYKITTGTWIVVLGTILVVSGAIERAQEETPVTIL